MQFQLDAMSEEQSGKTLAASSFALHSPTRSSLVSANSLKNECLADDNDYLTLLFTWSWSFLKRYTMKSDDEWRDGDE